MNRILRFAMSAMIGGSLVACAGIHDSKVPARPVSADYAVLPGDASGVVAFVYGKRTVLEFKVVPAFLSIKDGKGESVEFEREGRYVRMARRLDDFTVSMNGTMVSFTALKPVRVEATPPIARVEPPAKLQADESAAPTPDTAAASAALSLMRQQLEEIKRYLAAARKKPASANELRHLNARLDQIEARIRSSKAIVLQITFPLRGVEFKPADDVAKVLVPAAKSADVINLHGYTDSRIAGLDDPAIAMGRALSARKYLVEHGVAPEKIRVYAKADGDFVAPNWTKTGKQKNRRVEVELITSPEILASN